jgi:hypothetical protein
VDIDTTFDFRSDSHGKDPDKYSKKLKEYHKYIWSKNLPSGRRIFLEDGTSKDYLIFKDFKFQHYLTSDSVANSLASRKAMVGILESIDSALIDSFKTLNSTIGGFLLFPGNRINGAATINGERGFNYFIADRFDLTLECIRLQYLNIDNPLSRVFSRYKEFFQLFDGFSGYVDFFLLKDLVDENYSSVKLFNAFGNPLTESPIPTTVESYMEYRDNSMRFTELRNQRIKKWAKTGQSTI